MDFEPLREDFLRITTDIVYCTVTTVDPKGRPRSRVMHPIFEVVGGRLRGWAVTDRTPLKGRHLAANPYVACCYWSPAQDTVAIDCTAEWVEDDDVLRQVWDIFARPDPPGWGDLSGYGEAGIHHPRFHVLGSSRTGSRSCAPSSSSRGTSPRGPGGGPDDGEPIVRIASGGAAVDSSSCRRLAYRTLSSLAAQVST